MPRSRACSLVGCPQRRSPETDYLADLADAASGGWPGTKNWESLEHGVQLFARCRAGHVILTARLCEARAEPANDGWTAELDITLDPGEELRQAANDAWHLLRTS